MGSLITETPHSEITATLEILDRHGVTREDLRKFRAAAPEVQRHMAYIFKAADTCTSISYTSDDGPKRLLKFVTSVSLKAIESFESSKNFKMDKKGPVQIYWLGDNFKKHFGRKVETSGEVAEIKVHALTQSSLDAPIITELGSNAEITLGQFFTLLSKQGKGESGPLLVNGWTNIAYIRDDEGVLWAVSASWGSGDGWDVEAYSVEGPLRWSDGRLILSR